MTSSEHGFALF